MFVNPPLDTLVVFVISEIVASHVRVSEAHVVEIVAHVSESITLAVLVNEGADGFGVLVKVIGMKLTLLIMPYVHRCYGSRSTQSSSVPLSVVLLKGVVDSQVLE